MSFINSYRFKPTDPCLPCVVYPIAIPVTTGLLSHVSMYNICDIFTLNDETLPLRCVLPTPEDSKCAYFKDLSGNGNDVFDFSTPPSAVRSFRYKTSAGIFGDSLASANIRPGFRVVNSWRWNNQVKTIIFLCQVDNVASGLNTRFQQGQFTIRFNSSNLSVSDGAVRNSALAGTSNTWHIVSCRTNNNIVLGLDKSYQNVKATAPTVANVDFQPFSTGNPANRFTGKFREMIIFSGSLTDAQVDDISDWLTLKWGL